ncbi:hypothetical protein FQ142_13340 [Microbacterium sp. ANT_H45B]|nr:hypothetical protein FQ142_13340 [Microbacterium sp. ANT_H45B]
MPTGSTELLSPDNDTGRGKFSAGPVRAEEIHKSRPANVWIHRTVAETAHSLTAHFDLPDASSSPRFVDFVEVQRQIGILQAHRQLGVPERDVFILDKISLRLVAPTAPGDASSARGIIRAHLVATGGGGRSRSLTQYFSLEGATGLIAVGKAASSLLPRTVYERIRRQSPTSTNGISLRSNYTYSEPIRIDPDDPLVSDHPSDHLTAIQTIADVERVALRQTPSTNVRSLKLTFQRYAELEPSPTLRLKVSGTGRLVAEVTQHDIRRIKITGSVAS